MASAERPTTNRPEPQPSRQRQSEGCPEGCFRCVTMMTMSDVTAIVVNDEAVSLADALRPAKLNGRLEFVREAIEAALIRQAAAQWGFVVSDDELQQAADDFRAARELYTEPATEAWLAAHHLSYGDWESLLELEILSRRVRERAVGDQVQQYFARHRLSFDRALINRIVVPDKDTALELRAQIIEEQSDFYALARHHSIDDATRPACGYAGAVGRDELDSVTEAAVFGAAPGSVIGPFKSDSGWQLIKVREVRKATFDDATRAAIEATLFREWLDEQRRKARVLIPLLAAEEEESAASDTAA